MAANPSVRISAETLAPWLSRVFQTHGLSAADATTAARALVKANLRGVDSHGVARVPMYCERLRRGVANPVPDIQVRRRNFCIIPPAGSPSNSSGG